MLMSPALTAEDRREMLVRALKQCPDVFYIPACRSWLYDHQVDVYRIDPADFAIALNNERERRAKLAMLKESAE